MDAIIEDLLDFALIEAQHLIISPRRVEIGSLLVDTLELLEPLARSRGLDIAARADDGLCVEGDRRRLLQTISNLLGNAIKFTPTGGRVAVVAKRSAQFAIFTVSDTGPGMSEEEASHIWERYWQAKGGSRGLGLGLSIAKGIVEALGGRIWASSRVGEGTAISFTIPLLGSAADHRLPP